MRTTHIKRKKKKQLLSKELIIKYLLEIYMNEEKKKVAVVPGLQSWHDPRFLSLRLGYPEIWIK